MMVVRLVKKVNKVQAFIEGTAVTAAIPALSIYGLNAPCIMTL